MLTKHREAHHPVLFYDCFTMTASGRFHATLSKSKFMAGFQCLKRLYLQIYNPELAAIPDESTLATLRHGLEVGALARQAYPGGVMVETGVQGLSEAINRTTQLLANPRITAIFEGTFKQANIVVRTDILARGPSGGWQLIEVKSASAIKEHYPYDVGIQQFVVRAAGIEVSPWLMHLNRDYVYDGHSYALDQLFTVQSLAPEVKSLQEELLALIRKQREILAQPAPPAVEPGPQCTKPVQCEFFDCCNKPLPEDHVTRLPGISSTKVNQLIANGIDSILKIPADFPLSERQVRACRCVQGQEAYIAEGLKDALGGLVYPLFFMDFETLNPPIPRYAGMRPYDHVPFQWSVHARRSRASDLEHYEFLAGDGSDPRLAFLRSLLDTLGREGQIVVYNRGFESQRLKDLSHWFPEYAESIAQVRSRLWDLLEVVRKHVYHPRFMGSFSLKSVLPALIPDMTYEGMEVSQGEVAGLAWEKMTRAEISEPEKLELHDALLAYCRQDTLAMVRLLDFLATASSGTK